MDTPAALILELAFILKSDNGERLFVLYYPLKCHAKIVVDFFIII